MEEPTRVAAVFARRLRAIREAKGWSQRRLAEELEAIGYPLNHSTVSRLETTGRASVEDLLAIAAALGVSPLFLVVPHEQPLQVADGLSVAARDAQLWVAGLGHLGYSRSTKRNFDAMNEYVKTHGSEEGQLPWNDAEFDALQGAGQRDLDFFLSWAPPGWNPLRVEVVDELRRALSLGEES